ncbi:unnamed protein product [Durusdinium trenchii]|uniref:Uncharacterized protein n=1 Tax=Durusdinium trenchii TaxID=1381693 RepID=A0ABP0N4U5_9DINO
MFGARSGVVGALRLGVRKLVFTESNCGLTEGFPELGSAWKAANVKLVLWFIAEKAVEFAKATGARVLEAGACCAWSLVSAIHVMEQSDLIMTTSEASNFYELITAHLLHWQGIREECASLNLQRWRLRPKHHALEETALAVFRRRLNPRFTQCFHDEAYLGATKRIATKCNSNTVLLRVFQRLLLLLGQRWQQTRDAAQ